MLFNKKPFDFIAIGDMTTDVFIELRDAWVENDNPTKTKELCMRFGDKIPYQKVDTIPAVGNSPNATVSAHRLGLKSALITNTGSDKYGKEQIAQLKKEGISTKNVRIHKNMDSNYNFILRWKAERTILVKHHEYDYTLPKIPETRWLYLSSLAENSLRYHQEIADYLEKNPKVKLAFQPGTFQIKLGAENLSRLYKRSILFFCNKEEAKHILKTQEDDIKILLVKMQQLGPKIIIITDGPSGAYVYDGNEIWLGPMYPDPITPIDRTGAGDAFASTFTSAMSLGKSIKEALIWGPINSMSVVQHVGAQKGLLSRVALEKYIKNAPEDYIPKKINF